MIETQVDVVICSYAKNDELLAVTHKGLQTLVDSEDKIKFNIYVVETNQEVSYDEFPVKHHYIETIHTDKPFGYHTYLNLGIDKFTDKAEWSCLCNNDLEFTKNWASILIATCKQVPNKLISASPLNPKEEWHKQYLNKISVGYGVRQQVAGWCLFQHKSVLEMIGRLDERIKFWFADNYYSAVLQHYKIPHILVGNSIVFHHENLEGTTTKQADWDKQTKHNMTYGAGDNFREIMREVLKNPDWGKVTETQKEEMRKQGKHYY